MKCPTCGADYDQANGDLLSPLGLGRDSGQKADSERADDGPGGPTRNGGNRRARISADWQPTQAQRAYCERQGKDPDSFLQAFTEYYRAKGTVWKDWGLVWMKACRDWKGHVSVNKEPVILLTLRDKELAQWKFRLSASFWSPWWGPRVGEPGCQVPAELLK